MQQYGIVDKFLFDKALTYTKTNILINTALVKFNSDSMEELMKAVAISYKKNLNYAMKIYKSAIAPNVKKYDFIKSYFGSNYLIIYTKLNNGNYLIVDKRDFKNEDIDKYTMLC